MRTFGTSLFAVTAAASLWFLCSYGYEIFRLVEGEGIFRFAMLDEVSVWFYRERSADGEPSSPYRMSRHLSIIEPLDGPNWEIRIPGWIPAAGALSILAVSGVALASLGKRRRDVATKSAAAPHSRRFATYHMSP
jgi:hypothetical protein